MTSTPSTSATYKVSLEVLREKHKAMIEHQEDNIKKCKEALNKPFGVFHLWSPANSFMNLAISNDMLHFLKVETMFLLDDSPDLSNLHKYIEQLFRWFAEAESEASTSVIREMEAKAKRTLLKMKLGYFVRFFDFPSRELISSTISIF